MFKYLWILIVLVLASVFLYSLYNAIKEAVDDGNTNISDILDYICCWHEGLADVFGAIFVLLCNGLIFLFIGSIVAFIKYYLG